MTWIDALFSRQMAELMFSLSAVGLVCFAVVMVVTSECRSFTKKGNPLKEPRLLDALDRLFTSGAIYDPENDQKVSDAIHFAMREAGKAKGRL